MASETPSRPAPRRLSTQLYLFCLVAAVVVPLLAFAGYLLMRFAANERARYEQEASQIARQIALVIDGELEGLVALLQGLATSAALARDDYAEFHDEARRLIEGSNNTVLLRGLDTRQYVNASRPLGSTLPQSPPVTPEERVAFLAGKAVTTDVYDAPSDGSVRIAVAIPIMRDGSPRYILAITVSTARIRDALIPAVPPGWIIGVADRRGRYVTHSSRHDSVTGKPGIAEYTAMATGRSGTFTAANFEGRMLLAGYYRTDFSNWLIAANIPQDVVERPLRQSLTALAALGTAALALSALLAYLFGRTVSMATIGLSQRAAALGEGRAVPPLSSRLAEFAVVGDALAAAGAAITERARERERSDEQRQLLINELNHRVKNTLATVQSIALQTMRGAVSMAEARDALSDRLVALAKVHDVLTSESWEGAELRDIVAGATGPHGGAERFVTAGPPVWLTPSLSLSLSLALHELATNAAKYGALSTGNGSVTVSWNVAGEGDMSRLTLRWAEQGGPPVQPPIRQGFGSRLIRSLSADIDATAAIDYRPDGVVCTIEAPLQPRTTPEDTTIAS